MFSSCCLCLACMSCGCCPTHQYQGPERLRSFQPSTHSPLQNVDQINPAAALLSLDNQLTLQVLKTDSLVSSLSQTWTVFSAPCCLLLFVRLCRFSNDKKILFLDCLLFEIITSRCTGPKNNTNTFVTYCCDDLFYVWSISHFSIVSHYLQVVFGMCHLVKVQCCPLCNWQHTLVGLDSVVISLIATVCQSTTQSLLPEKLAQLHSRASKWEQKSFSS